MHVKPFILRRPIQRRVVLLLLLLLLLLLIVKNVKESAMTSSEAFYLNNMSLGRRLKPKLCANNRVMMEFLISCIQLQA